MTIPDNIQSIEVYYDGRCAICCTFHEWVNRQQRSFPVRFIAYQSDQAEIMFPGISQLDPDRDMIVRTDQGDVFRGAEGWVLCLYSCRDYQGWAKRLASPRLIHAARKMCRLIASNRIGISKVVFGKMDAELLREIHAMPESPESPEGRCDDGCCLDEVSGQPRDVPDGLF